MKNREALKNFGMIIRLITTAMENNFGERLKSADMKPPLWQAIEEGLISIDKVEDNLPKISEVTGIEVSRLRKALLLAGFKEEDLIQYCPACGSKCEKFTGTLDSRKEQIPTLTDVFQCTNTLCKVQSQNPHDPYEKYYTTVFVLVNGGKKIVHPVNDKYYI